LDDVAKSALKNFRCSIYRTGVLSGNLLFLDPKMLFLDSEPYLGLNLKIESSLNPN